jgi:hypothetical protein
VAARLVRPLQSITVKGHNLLLILPHRCSSRMIFHYLFIYLLTYVLLYVSWFAKQHFFTPLSYTASRGSMTANVQLGKRSKEAIAAYLIHLCLYVNLISFVLSACFKLMNFVFQMLPFLFLKLLLVSRLNLFTLSPFTV